MEVKINTAKAIEESKKLIKGIFIPEIKTKEDFITATASMAKIKSAIKWINDKRMTITRPIDEAKKNTIALFQPYLDKLELNKGQLDPRIKEWGEKKEKERIALQAKIDAENQRKQDEIDKRIENAKKESTKERLAEEKEIIANTQFAIIPEKTEGGHWVRNQKWRYQKGCDSNSTELKKELLDKYPHLIKIDESALSTFAVQVKRTVQIRGLDFYEDKNWVTKQ